MSVIDEALDYQKYVASHGTYQLSKIIQLSGGQGAIITPSGGSESMWEIPPKVFNSSKSFLNFTATPDSRPANNFNYMYTDGFCYIRQLQLLTRTNTLLVDINDVDKYTNMTFRRKTSIEDVTTWDKVGGVFKGLIPCNTTADLNLRLTYGTVGSKTAYLEPNYVQVGAAVANPTPVMNVVIHLNKLYNTLLAENKDLYFNGEMLYLRIIWAATTRIYFRGTSATNPDTGAVAAAGDVTLSNLALYLAIEVNPEIENMIRTKCASPEGLQILMPYVWYNKSSLPGPIYNVSTRYNRAHGIKLQKIYYAAYNNTELANTAFDHNNKPGAIAAPAIKKLTSFYTMINSIRTSQFDYVFANSTDYIVKKDSLRGSSILSSDEYYYNWVWVEDFTMNNDMYEKLGIPAENCVDGLDLTNEIKYDIYATNSFANPTLSHYVYAIGQKLLTISPSGINLS